GFQNGDRRLQFVSSIPQEFSLLQKRLPETIKHSAHGIGQGLEFLDPLDVRGRTQFPILGGDLSCFGRKMLQRKESATNAQQGKKYGRPQQYETGQGNVNSGGQDLVAQGQSWLSVDHDQGIGAGW